MYATTRDALYSDQETQIRHRVAFRRGKGAYEGRRPIKIYCDSHLMPCKPQIRYTPFSWPDLRSRLYGISSNDTIRCQRSPHLQSCTAW